MLLFRFLMADKTQGKVSSAQGTQSVTGLLHSWSLCGQEIKVFAQHIDPSAFPPVPSAFPPILSAFPLVPSKLASGKVCPEPLDGHVFARGLWPVSRILAVFHYFSKQLLTSV